ncbi:uncharacterized protein LOC110914516 [Helianthus annuus]|uniref:uncharacterized protein LOC110914516 n=1 Tax=Helianthus annuus TaxID=4232 RepID=UPI000B8FDDC2|nr:uncharacterized protein LOC110914516 [Helianthus annuus]
MEREKFLGGAMSREHELGMAENLSIRCIMRPHIWSLLKSGLQTNVWSDNWCPMSPLSSFITPRSIANAGFSLKSSVADVIDAYGHWRWPQAWLDLFPVLISIQTPQLVGDALDRLAWKNLDGKFIDFESAQVWNTIRTRDTQVTWANMVWFSQCVPRHSFHMWLVLRNKLKTQDRLAVWEAGSATNLNLMCCPLCKHDRDSRNYLFFQCAFANQVWTNVKCTVNLESVDNTWQSLMVWVDQHSNSKKTDAIVCKLVVAVATYYIWQERNSRLFSSNQLTVVQVAEKIKSVVRLQLMGFKFRVELARRRIYRTWKIDDSKDDVADPG